MDEALVTLPASAEGHALDLTDEQAVKAFFAGLGAFDHLAFTAGETLQLGRLSETDIGAARAFFGLRYWGAYMAAKYGSSGIRPGGSIVFTSGLAGTRPHAGWSLGASICSAMEGLTRALAVELAPIRVNIVSPGVVKSPLWANMTVADREALYRQTAEKLPVGHVGEQSSGHGDVGDVSRGQRKRDRAAAIIGQSRDFARSSAARTANRFRELPLFEAAAERCALTWLLAMESSSGTGPAAAIFSKMRGQIRRWDQRL